MLEFLFGFLPTPLETIAYGMTLLSMFLLAKRMPLSGFMVGMLDVVPWTILALTQFNSPGMLVLEVIFLGVNLYGFVNALRHSPIHSAIVDEEAGFHVVPNARAYPDRLQQHDQGVISQ